MQIYISLYNNIQFFFNLLVHSHAIFVCPFLLCTQHMLLHLFDANIEQDTRQYLFLNSGCLDKRELKILAEEMTLVAIIYLVILI